MWSCDLFLKKSYWEQAEKGQRYDRLGFFCRHSFQQGGNDDILSLWWGRLNIDFCYFICFCSFCSHTCFYVFIPSTSASVASTFLSIFSIRHQHYNFCLLQPLRHWLEYELLLSPRTSKRHNTPANSLQKHKYGKKKRFFLFPHISFSLSLVQYGVI